MEASEGNVRGVIDTLINVLIASIVERHGYDGLVLATLIAGPIMMGAGFLRLGTYIKYIPFPVTVGFTAGIAVNIFASQVKGRGCSLRCRRRRSSFSRCNST